MASVGRLADARPAAAGRRDDRSARRSTPRVTIAAVVFDLDGVLIDSEQLWDRARRDVVAERGGAWRDEATRAMMGMSSPEWSRYMHDELDVDIEPAAISNAVVERLERLYRDRLPLLPGAVEAVAAAAERWPLGLASSANRQIIELVLALADLERYFEATVSSEEVPRGKPAPDVYLESAQRLGVPAVECAAVEDSTNGLRSAAAAGMKVIAIPNASFPPSADALQLADAVIASLAELQPTLLAL
jgi:HAD superfamily hydrolase (TIGR01509 family)